MPCPVRRDAELREGRASPQGSGLHQTAPGRPAGGGFASALRPTATSTDDDAVAAYGPKSANAGSEATHCQARPSVDAQIPPRQLCSPDGPVARNPSGVTVTPNI